MSTYQETNAVADSTHEVMKVQYTAKTHTSGGRRGGISRSDDGRLDVKFCRPEFQERRRFRVAAGRFRKRQKPGPAGVRRSQPSARRAGRAGVDF